MARKGKPRSHPDSKKASSSRYISRTLAVRKLQISLKDFRRLCILKGIYPREPKGKLKKAGNRTYYLTKDIMFLAHEPVLTSFREFKTFLKKYSRALGRGDKGTQKRLKNHRPTYQIDHIIKERYPTFQDALADLDDALCMVHLFAVLPQSTHLPSHRTANCRRLANEFQSWVAHSKTLVKTFASVKGMYYQALILDQPVTWLVPHKFAQRVPRDVDFKVMLTFLELYEVLVHFVNLRLYRMSDLYYPPQLDRVLESDGTVFGALTLASDHKANPSLNPAASASAKADNDAAPSVPRGEMNKRVATLKKEGVLEEIARRDASKQGEGGLEEEEAEEKGVDDEAEVMEDAAVFGTNVRPEKTSASVFDKCVVFLSQEVPVDTLHFILASGGAKVCWEGAKSPLPVTDGSITHAIVDRPQQQHRFLSREYCQPQWVLDSFNAQCLLPADQYAPGIPPPPHLSPFVDNEAVGYTPARAKQIRRIVAAAHGEEIEDDSEDEEQDPRHVSGQPPVALPAATPHAQGQHNNGQEEEEDEEEEAEEEGSEEEEEEEEEGSEEEEEEVDKEEDALMLDDESANVSRRAFDRAYQQQQRDNINEEELEYKAELEAERQGKSFKEHTQAAKRKRAAQPAPSANPLRKRKKVNMTEEEEQREMAIKMMPKKKFQLYRNAMHGKQKKMKEVMALEAKAKKLARK